MRKTPTGVQAAGQVALLTEAQKYQCYPSTQVVQVPCSPLFVRCWKSIVCLISKKSWSRPCWLIARPWAIFNIAQRCRYSKVCSSVMAVGGAILAVQFCLCSEEHLRNSVAAATLVRPDRNLLCRRNHHSLLRFAWLWIRPQHVSSAEHSATAPLFLRLLQPTGNNGSRLHRLFRQLSHDVLSGQLEDALNNL